MVSIYSGTSKRLGPFSNIDSSYQIVKKIFQKLHETCQGSAHFWNTQGTSDRRRGTISTCASDKNVSSSTVMPSIDFSPLTKWYYSDLQSRPPAWSAYQRTWSPSPKLLPTTNHSPAFKPSFSPSAPSSSPD